MTFETNKQYNFSVKGFTYLKDWAFIVFAADAANYKVIIGSKQQFPMSELMMLKGNSVEVTYRGVKNINGIDYSQFSLDCIAF